MPDHDRDLTGERLAQGGRILVRAAQHVRQEQLGVVVEDRLRSGQIGLRQAQQRFDVGVVRGHQASVDEPGTRRRVGQRDDDHELVGVRDDYPFQAALGRRVVIVGGTPEDGRPLLDPDDPRERALATGDVADNRDPVADHDTAPAEFPGPHRGHRGAVDLAGEPAAVDRHHEAERRLLVFGPHPRTGTGRLAGPYPDVVFVIVALFRRQSAYSRRSRVHRYVDCISHHSGPQLRELRHCRRRARDVGQFDPRYGEAEHRAGVRHPMVLVGLEDATGQRTRPDQKSVR